MLAASMPISVRKPFRMGVRKPMVSSTAFTPLVSPENSASIIKSVSRAHSKLATGARVSDTPREQAAKQGPQRTP